MTKLTPPHTVIQKSNIFRTAVSVATLSSKWTMTAMSWHTMLSVGVNGVLRTMP